MKALTKYIANDGEEFETEKECVMYEKFKEKIPDFFLAYDDEYDRITEISRLDAATYLIIKEDETLNDFLSFADEYFGLSFPEEPGRWDYNFDADRWDNLDEVYEKNLKKRAIFDNLERGLNYEY